MDVYIEYIFLDNLAVNMFLLYLTVYILKKHARLFLIFCSATFGAIFSVLYPFLGVYNYIVKALLAVVMVIMIRKYKSFSDYFSTLVTFYIISFTLAGAVLMLTAFTVVDLTKYTGKVQLFPFCLFGSSLIILILAKYCISEVYKRKKICSLVYPASMELSDGERIDVNAFYDSGNQLYDPEDGSPIVIISKRLYDKIPHIETGNILIRTVAGYKNLTTINITFRLYFTGKMNKIYKVRAGVSDDINGDYDIILHTEMTGE